MQLDMSSLQAEINEAEVHAKVKELEDSLLTNHPTMPVLLRNIHTQLQKDPTVVTLLTDEEVGTIVSGLKRQTQTEISAKVLTKKVSLKNLSINDL